MEEEIFQSTVVTERTEILVDTTYSVRDLWKCTGQVFKNQTKVNSFY